MKAHNTELISALLDGELKGLRRWRVQRHVDRCASCANEFRRLQRVREMLASQAQPPMSDSADFFWSKVRREIQATSGQRVSVPVPRLSFADWLGRHQLAFEGVSILLIVIGMALPLLKSHTPAPIPPINAIAKVETALPDTTATTFTAPDGDAVIWVSGLPWSKDMNEMQTTFASL